MKLSPIKTRRLLPPKDSFIDALCEGLSHIPEQSVIALSSKAVAIGEGRCVPVSPDTDVRALKDSLAQKDSEFFVPRENISSGQFTIIHGTLMSSAGIDESNGNNHLILWPEDPMRAAREYRVMLKERYGVSDLGVIVVDSHSVPLRNGAVGITIGYAGFLPVRDYRGAADLFGRAFKFERFNAADSLAVAATIVMGEGAESTPAALIEDIPLSTFTDIDDIPEDPFLQLTVSREQDYFQMFLRTVPWQKGGGGYHM